MKSPIVRLLPFLGISIIFMMASRFFEPSRGWTWFVVLILLGLLAIWSDVRLEPFGSVDLLPIVALASVVNFGIWEGFAVVLLIPLLVQLLSWTRWFARVASHVKQRSIVLFFSLLFTWLVFGRPTTVDLAYRILPIASFTFSVLALTFLIDSCILSLRERVPLGRVIESLSREATLHYFFLLLAGLVVWTLSASMGPLGLVLIVVVVVELHYPRKLLGEQRELLVKSLQMLSNAVDLKDPYTAHHSRRVAEYALAVARELGVPEKDVRKIRIAGLMHDIGKIGVPGSIIRKPGKLTTDEMELMKRHVEMGVDVIENLETLEEAAGVVACTHENFDGSGYPSGLRGEEIPLASRIIFVVDAFDAITTDRPYRRGRPFGEALRTLEQHAGAQFDPRVFRVFKRLVSAERLP